ncbi:MAG: hypothetical protein J6R04_00810 [Clostridia bacterium]|nr:hypothetical protein [Clostridia bacterium]
MKRILSFVLAVLTVLSCAVFSVGAAEEGAVIPFANCDSMAGWTGWREAMPSLDTKEFSEGKGSITLSRQGAVEGALPGTVFQFHYTNTSKAVDVSSAEALVFDLYVANVAGVEDVPFSFELNSSGLMDTDEISGMLYLGDMVEGGLREGWNTAVLEIDKLTARKGEFDATKCCFFRVSNGSATIGTEGKTTTLKVDNFRFVTDASSVGTTPEKPTASSILFSNCDTMSGWSGWSGAMPSLDTEETFKGGGSITRSQQGAVEGAQPGTVFQFCYRGTSNPIDITGSEALVFALYIANVAGVEDVPFSFELNSSGLMDTDEISGVLYLGDMVAGGLQEGWNTAVLPIAKLTARVGSFDATKCCFFRVSNGSATIGTEGKTTTMKLDELRFVSDASSVEQGGDAPATEEGTLMLSDCDSIGRFVVPSGNTVASGTGWHCPGLRVDTEEKVQGAASVSLNITTLHADAASGSVVHLMYNTDTPLDISNKDALSFDVYVSDIAGVAETEFEVEIRSVGWTGSTGDTVERQTVIRLADYVVGEFDAGWNHIEIPLDRFPQNAKFDPTQCCYFRMFNRRGNIGIKGKNVVLKMDNICFIDMEDGGAPRTTVIAKYLTDGAVYQQNKPLAVWGVAPAGTEVRAELYGEKGEKIDEAEMTVGNDYSWLLELAAQKGGYTPYSVKVYVGGALRKEVKDILFGEVWLASGQSNMEMILNNTYEKDDLYDTAFDEYLRIFNQVVTPAISPTPQADVLGSWIKGDKPTALQNVSAIAYSFARELRSALDVPVAVISAARGSTVLECWLEKSVIDGDAAFKQRVEGHGLYKEIPALPADMSAMYNSKIAPLTNLSIAGVIWYQGESNSDRGDMYEQGLELLYDSWSRDFGFEEDTMPFIFAQVAPYTRSSSVSSGFRTMANLKQSMLNFYLAHTKTTAMIPIYDLSLRYQDTPTLAQSAVIHPTTKLPVAYRMARAALGLCYGGDEATAPTVREIRFEDGAVYVTFDHVDISLTTTNDTNDLLGFALGNEKGMWVNAEAKLVKADTVKITSPYMSDAAYVSYAWDDLNDNANLCASNGIPAAPFCSGGRNGLGTRPYLECDGDVFVTTSFVTGTPQGTGAAAYVSLWNDLVRAQVSYDDDTRSYGLASVHATYTPGAGEAVIGMDLTEASTYTVAVGLGGVHTFAVDMKNGDARDKQVRLGIRLQSGKTVYTAPVTLAANADFTTLLFDIDELTDDKGEKASSNMARSQMIGLSLCVADSEGGEVWIDHMMLGSDPLHVDEPDTPVTPDEPSEPTEPTVEPKGGNTLLVVVIILGAVAIAAVAVVIVVVKKKKA